MDFTPWTVFTDLGLIAVLLLFGQWLRAKIGLIQRLFLPANVLAGLLGLTLGPNGFSILPFSNFLATYPGILIALIFAAIPFAVKDVPLQANRRAVVELSAYSTLAILLQWSLGMCLALGLLRIVWPDLPSGFGLILPTGFVGGHGTAAAIGAAFADRGWADAGALAMTSATIGILGAVVGGMIWIQWGARNGSTHFIARFEDLPPELRTGLVPQDRRESLGQETLSPMSIDPLAFHVALVLAVTVGGYYLGHLSATHMGTYRLPTFCLAFLLAMGVKQLFRFTGVLTYIDPKTTVRLSGTFTDILVAFGIASVQIPILIKYAAPLIALFVFGIFLCWVLFRLVGPRAFHDMWFEKSLYTWGWTTGVMALAIALLRITDPGNKSHILGDFALAYLVAGFVEVLLVTLAPILVSQGRAWTFTIAALIPALVILILTIKSPGSRPGS